MRKPVEITSAELALILDALEDAAFYRDTRSRVLKAAMRRSSRRSLPTPTSRTSSSDSEGPTEPEDHVAKAQAYTALATQLIARGNGGA